MAIDPVCGMEVDEKTTKQKAVHQDQNYFFCSADCKEDFESEPEEYVGGDDLQPA